MIQLNLENINHGPLFMMSFISLNYSKVDLVKSFTETRVEVVRASNALSVNVVS